MEPWQQSLANSLTRPAELAERFGIDPSLLEAVVRRYPMRITPHYLGLIREAGDPIWRQCVPEPVELRDEEAPEDPLARGEPLPRSRPGPPLPRPCAASRFGSLRGLLPLLYPKAQGRLRRHVRLIRRGTRRRPRLHRPARPEIRDVILSGGDPLLLSDETLLQLILTRLRAHPPRGDDPHRQPRAGDFARAYHGEPVRRAGAPPSPLPQHPLQPPPGAHPGGGRGLRPARRRRHPARQPDGAAARGQRRPGDDGRAAAGSAENPGAPLLPPPHGPGARHGAFPHPGGGGNRNYARRCAGRSRAWAFPATSSTPPAGRGKVPILPEYLEELGDTVVLRLPDGERLEFPNKVGEG